MATNQTFKEELLLLTNENSNALDGIYCNLEVLDSLNTQVGWLQGSFDGVDYKKEDARLYFQEWRTNITVISSLLCYLNKEIREEHTKLEYLAEGFRELAREETKSPQLTAMSNEQQDK